MSYGKSLAGGLVAALIAFIARTVFVAVNSYKHTVDPSGLMETTEYTVSLGPLDSGAFVALLVGAFATGFLFTLVMTHRSTLSD